MESVLLSEHENAPDCSLSLEDSIDQSYYLWQNSTDPSSTFLELLLNVTGLISDPVVRLVRHCPVAIEHQLLGYASHFDQFTNATFGQVAESFMFGLLI